MYLIVVELVKSKILPAADWLLNIAFPAINQILVEPNKYNPTHIKV